jgi:hypothetical protein
MNNPTPLEGSSVIIEEQNIVQDGVTFIQEKLSTVDFNNNEDQVLNSEEVEWNDDGGGDSTDYSEVEHDSSDSSIKLNAQHIQNKSNKKFRIAADEDVDDRSECCKSDNSRFSQTPSIEQQGEPELLQFS